MHKCFNKAIIKCYRCKELKEIKGLCIKPMDQQSNCNGIPGYCGARYCGECIKILSSSKVNFACLCCRDKYPAYQLREYLECAGCLNWVEILARTCHSCQGDFC